MNVYQKLQFARVKLQETGFKKTGWNSYSEYKYFELGDFLLPIQTLFANIGLCGVVSYEGDRAFLRITNVEKLEECIVIESPMSTAKLKAAHEVQNLGAVQTYIRRYLWMTALEIVEHDAIDASAGAKTDKPVDKPEAPAMKTPNGSAMRASEEAFVAMDAEEQQFLTVQAALILTAEDPHAIYAKLDQDERIAIWHLIPSDVRRVIKAAGSAK